LPEYVGAEPAQPLQRDGEVDLELALQYVFLVFVHDAVSGIADLVNRQQVLAQGHDLPLYLDLDRRHGSEKQVRGVLLRHQLEERCDVHRYPC